MTGIKEDYSTLSRLIKRRRAVFPNMYDGKSIDRETIEKILESAKWAPTHKRTEPWRFVVIRGDHLKRLGKWLAEDYKARTPEDKFVQRKYEKPVKKMIKSGAVIAICMERDAQQRIPEWEEIAAVACAVQNMWLTCTALGIGSYWSSPNAIERIGPFLQLKPEQRCLGLFYMGHWNQVELPAERQPIDEKTTWLGG